MKLFFINSNAIFKKGRGFFIYKSTAEFLVRLNEAGYKIEIFHFLSELEDNDFLANYNLANKGIKITTVKKFKSKLISYIKAYAKGIRKIVDNDFFYLFYPNSFYPLCFFAILINKPFGLYVRGEKGLESRISKFLFKKAKFITTVSPKFSKTINSLGGNAITISPMMDYSILDIVYDRSYEEKRLYKILFVGRVEINKGVFELIKSIKELIKLGYKNLYLDIVGEGPHFQEAKREVNNLGLSRFINFHGSIYDKNKLKWYYSNADIFILPTYHEGFPRVLYEAMIFGTPILTTFVGAIPYIMKDKYNCYEIQPKSVNDISKYLNAFLKNYKQMSKVAKEGTKTITHYFQKYALSHEEIISQKLK